VHRAKEHLVRVRAERREDLGGEANRLVHPRAIRWVRILCTFLPDTNPTLSSASLIMMPTMSRRRWRQLGWNRLLIQSKYGERM
jgi:hypothetical protein